MRSTPLPTKAPPNRPAHQRGFVLVTALIFLMVLSLLGVMAMRGSLFEERFAANDRDLAVARENAELALRDAERDILGLRFDGQYCDAVACTTLRTAGTRPVSAADAGNFWVGSNENINDVAKDNGGIGLGLEQQGVYTALSAAACGMPVWSGADWQDGVTRSCAGTITTNIPTIPYGSFTDAPFAQQGVTAPRYLIEMFTAGDLQIANGKSNKIIFRITAVGFGRTFGSTNTGANGTRTSVTLQSVFSAL